MEAEEVKVNGIARSVPNQLAYSIILFVNNVANEMMQLVHTEVLRIELTLHIRVLFSDYTYIHTYKAAIRCSRMYVCTSTLVLLAT